VEANVILLKARPPSGLTLCDESRHAGLFVTLETEDQSMLPSQRIEGESNKKTELRGKLYKKRRKLERALGRAHTFAYHKIGH